MYALSPHALRLQYCLVLALLRSSRSDCSRKKVGNKLDVELSWFLPMSRSPCSYGIVRVDHVGLAPVFGVSVLVEGKVIAEKHTRTGAGSVSLRSNIEKAICPPQAGLWLPFSVRGNTSVCWVWHRTAMVGD